MHMASLAVSIGLTFVCAATLSACAGNREIPAADLAAAQTTTIGVNSYLWRAALDTLSFAPIAQLASAGGVTVTDWYDDPPSPGRSDERSVGKEDERSVCFRVAAIDLTNKTTNKKR